MSNVILVFIDSLRQDHLGCYGNNWIKTPNLDAFNGESLSFSQVYPESLPTLPVRRATMTGNRAFPFHDWKPVLGDFIYAPGWEPLHSTDITIQEVLYESGYRTAFITDVYHFFKPNINYHRGFLEFRFIRGQERDLYDCSFPDVDLDHYITPKMKGTVNELITRQYLTNTRHRKSEEDYFSPTVFKEAIRWLERNKDADKFYLHIDCFDPHEPWDPPKKYWSLYNDPDYQGRQIICPENGDPLIMSENELNHAKALYAGEVTMVDCWFGKLMNKVRELGLEKNTLIIVLADHGLPLGEHNILKKLPYALYPELMDIPLMIRYPDGNHAGERRSGYFYNHDLFKTILNFTGVKISHEVEALDLTDPSSNREYVTSCFKDYVWAKTDDFAFFCRMDGTEIKLFDLKEDPGQFANRADDKPTIAKEMFDLILQDSKGPLPDFGLPKGTVSLPRINTALGLTG